jgi:hypothetical protein
VTQPDHATPTPAVPLSATAAPYECVNAAPVGTLVDLGGDQAPALHVRTTAVEPSVQATAARAPSAATAGRSVDVPVSPPVGLHVRPAFVDTLALTAPPLLDSHATTTVLPFAAMRGIP